MSKKKPYVSRVGTLQEGMAAIGRLPRIITDAIGMWGKVEVVVRPYEPKKSHDQDRLQGKWCKEAAEQGDMTAEEYRGFVKLHFGVPILCRDSDEYRQAYERIIRPLPYDQQLALMQRPFDFAVTRGMTKRQKAEFLNDVWNHFTGLGFRLTDPSLRGMENWRQVA